MPNSTTLPASAEILARILAAQQEYSRDRHRGLEQLNRIFREGRFPGSPLDGPGLHGPTSGQMLATNLGPGFSPLVHGLLTNHMPWRGKVFDAAASCGENLFYPGFKPVSRVMFPLYTAYTPESTDTFRAFPFKTWSGPGLNDPDRDVLKIDYQLPVNPLLSIRRIMDELVQVADNYYLGKAYFRTWWGEWHLLFYFALQRL